MRVLFLFALLMIGIGCQKSGHSSNEKVSSTEAVSSKVLKKGSNGMGETLMVQVPVDLSEKEYLALMRTILKKHPKVVNVNFVGSSETVDALDKMEGGTSISKAEMALLANSHILVYNKLGEKGEVWWLQQTGKVAHKNGTITPM